MGGGGGVNSTLTMSPISDETSDLCSPLPLIWEKNTFIKLSYELLDHKCFTVCEDSFQNDKICLKIHCMEGH